MPVARVCVDVALPHLDRLFDYQVPSELDGAAQPGTRVKVRFSGKLADGWLIDRAASSEHPKLAWLEKVVSAEPVLRPEVVALAREIAHRYAGSLADVLRLAIPPRQAAVEKETPATLKPEQLDLPDNAGWSRYPAGAAFLAKLAEGESPRAVWSALPGEDWPSRVAEAIAATLHSGRGAVAVVADARDLSRLDAALTTLIGAGHHVALSAALGPAERYRRFLKASRGDVRAVIGTRATAFAPVERLGLVAIWDDGDDVHAEPRAPYPHARQVLLSRSVQANAAVLVGGFARTAEAQQLLSTGWAREVAASRETIRVAAPEVQPADDNALARDPAAASARLPSVAWNAARSALQAKAPVLVQVPRRGYVPAVSCQDCRERARCPHCAGPLTLGSSGAPPSCRWCARPAAGFICPACGGRRLRAAITGVRRTAEEMGRAFPDVPVMTSGGENILSGVRDEPALVLSTPGAEPVAERGYGAVLLLDSWALLTRSDLRAGEEAARRWFQAAALAKPASAGGKVVVVADGSLAQVQALIRWDPGWLADRELAERRALRFPPAAQLASLTGVQAAVSELLDATALPPGAEVLGPLPVGEDQERMLVRVRRSAGPALAEALHAAAGVRSARKAADPVRIQLDPQEL
ncbi:primosomal protein N' [Catelliglobosispora koreensis]|uniref:primosomal protein N' n=1 Tax=Catelliglobosispora koreensis TaxID=129052 RepID=UPI00146EE00F|nr:primosomal protein N' [Catelliglobosispora koreensis]